MTTPAEPTLSELHEQTRALYIALCVYRVGSRVEEAEEAFIADAQDAALRLVSDMKKSIAARQNKLET